MSTDYPYSQQWRERTRERKAALGLSLQDIREGTGLLALSWFVIGGEDSPVSLEVAGPIDELLDRLEEQREAKALEECVVHHPGLGSPRVRRVDVDLGKLQLGNVEFTDTPRVPGAAVDALDRRAALARRAAR